LQNPNLQQAMNFIKSAGSPQAALAMLAQQNGLTIEDLKELLS